MSSRAETIPEETAVDRFRRILVVLVVTFGALLGAVAPAHAEDKAYRYWGYWQYAGGAWQFAQKGADELVPADGSVEGWRFASVGPADQRTPRAAGDFAAICAGAPAEPGRKRVAVVIDRGTAQDAPNPAADKPGDRVEGTCVVAAPEATGGQVLAAAAPVRADRGMTCGIGGYPAAGCSDPVPVPVGVVDEPRPLTVLPPKGSATHPAETAPASPLLPWAVGGALVLTLAGGALVVGRRRRAEAA